VFDTFTCDSDITEYEASMDGTQIVITAYAIQAEGLTAEKAAEALGLN
jgi:hypothetical protein